jgi:ribose transport system substrate-binding protein
MLSKKILGGISVAVASALVLAGCSSGQANEAATESKGAIAMSFGGLDIPIWNDMLAIMEPQITAAGYEFLSDDPQWDIQTQVTDWQNWIQRGDVKTIMGYPVQSDSMVAVTQEAQEAGISVLGYAGSWEGTDYSLVLNNFEDGKTLGEAAGKWIIETYGTALAQPVALLGYWETDLGRERSEGIVAGLDASGANVAINELSVINLDDGYTAAQNQLAAFPDTKIFLGMASEPAEGAYQFLMDSGVASDDQSYLIGALDATDSILDIFLTPDSIWQLSYILPAKSLADAMVEMMIGAAEGTLTADIEVASTMVTRDNAKSFYSTNK